MFNFNLDERLRVEKQTIRKIFLQKRAELSSPDFAKLNEFVQEKTQSLLLEIKPKVVHLFLPIPSKKELITLPIAKFCWKQDIQTVVPVCDFATGQMTSIEFTSATELQQSNYGIPEPVYGVEIHPEKIDLVLTPLLAFDELGHRVGYGKGFYDDFFRSCKPDVHKVGLSLFDPIEKINDIFEGDVPLTHAITPSQTYLFK